MLATATARAAKQIEKPMASHSGQDGQQSATHAMRYLPYLKHVLVSFHSAFKAGKAC